LLALLSAIIWEADCKAQLEALNTWNSVLRVMERIERALIVEFFEWGSLVLGAASHKG
jgi:hypothetical protein